MKYLFFITLLSFSMASNAQSNKEAEALLSEVRQKTESYTSQTISFTNEIDAPTGNPAKPRSSRSSEGVAKIKGQKFRIELEGMIMINDGSKSYMIYPDEQEINVFQEGEESLSLTPSSILASYKTGYSFAMAGKETVDGKTIQYVRLKPKASAEVKEIIVGINMANKQLYSFKQFGHDDVITSFTVKSYQVNVPLKDALFSIKSAEFSSFDLYEE